MKLEEKINEIGRMVADIKLDVYVIKKEIKEIKKWMVYPELLKTRRTVEKIFTQKKPKR